MILGLLREKGFNMVIYFKENEELIIMSLVLRRFLKI